MIRSDYLSLVTVSYSYLVQPPASSAKDVNRTDCTSVEVILTIAANSVHSCRPILSSVYGIAPLRLVGAVGAFIMLRRLHRKVFIERQLTSRKRYV